MKLEESDFLAIEKRLDERYRKKDDCKKLMEHFSNKQRASEPMDDLLPGTATIFTFPWKVCCGTYNNPMNAISIYEEAHEKGFDLAFIEDADGKVVMF